MTGPRVSVILPVRDGAAFLGAAMRSVLGQDVAQLIVIDDMSGDATPDLLADAARADARVQVLAGLGAGPAAARNLGLGAATGDVIGFVDADDLWPAGKLALQLARLARAPHADVVSGLVRYFEKPDETGLAPLAGARSFDTAHVNLGAALFRRAAFDRVGTFDADLRYSEDVDLMFRMMDDGLAVTVLNAPMLYYRRHPAQMTAAKTGEEQRDFRTVMARTALRRRAGNIVAPPKLADLIEDLS